MSLHLPKFPQTEHVHLRSMGARLMLVALCSALAVAGITVGAAFDIAGAVARDGKASMLRLADVSQLVERRFVDDARKVTAQTGASSRGASCASEATATLAHNGQLAAVGVATAAGAMGCVAGNAALADRQVLRRASVAKEFVMGDYAFDNAASLPTVTFAASVEGSPDQIAFAVVNVLTLTDEGLRAALPKDSAFGVTDAAGKMLLRGPETDGWAGRDLPEKALHVEMLSRKHGTVVTVGSDGIRRLYAFAQITGVTPPSGYVYVGVPVAAAFSISIDAVYRDAFIALLLMLVALWTAYTLGDILILRRVRKMVGGMRHQLLGEHEELPMGLGELDDLTAVFAKITERLKVAQEQTDDKVRTRTADLEFSKGMAELEKARIEALLASIGEGVIATDKAGKVIFINHEAEMLTGFTSADLVGKAESATVTFLDEKGETLDEARRPTRIALEKGERAELPGLPKPCSFVRKDGTAFPALVTVSPVSFGTRIIGAIEVIRDITDEAEFDRRKTEFISIASHQLRSPLAATKWLSDMLRKGDLGALAPKQQEIADKLFIANERMVVLVNELLNVSRIDSGVTKASLRPANLRALLEAVVTDTMPLLAEKKQTFVYAPADLPTVQLDELLFREVVANLVSNASKYSPEGTTVAVTAEKRGDEIVVGIKDSGIGIPLADQNQLFKKFFRANNALKSAIQGTGLGLYFVKSVVDLHGGRIWFESAENKGTTFFVSLPLGGPAAPKADAAPSADPKAPPSLPASLAK